MMLDYIFYTICWLIAFILIAAAWGKLSSLGRFKLNLTESFGFPARLSEFVAPLIVILELLLAVTIISDTYLTYFAMLTTLLIFIIFTSFLLYHWLQNARVKCSCFGEDDRPVSVFDLLRNGLVVLLIGFYLFFGDSEVLLTVQSQVLLVSIALTLSAVIIHTHDIAMLLLTARGKL